MAVRLQAEDVQRLHAAQRVLLSPLSHEDPMEWQLRANRAVRRLIGADHSVFSLASNSRPDLLTDDTDPALPERFLAYFAGVVAGEYRFRDPVLQNAERRRRAAGGGAFHELDLESRDAIRRSVAIQEIFRPAGLTTMVGLSSSTPEGEATQFFGFEGADGERRSERGVGLLQLLVPAFHAGVRLQRQWLERGAAFAAALDRIGRAAAIYSMGGRPLHRTDALARLLDAEPESATLLQSLDRLVRDVVACCRPQREKGDTTGIVQARTRVRCGGAEYALVAGWLESALIGTEAVLVSVERRRLRFPVPRELTARFGLTGREAEVALLLAQGLTDGAVARHLALSPHTARRYSERVLTKLGIHSRAAVAFTILNPEPSDPA